MQPVSLSQPQFTPQNPLSDDTFFCSLLLLTARIFLCDNQGYLPSKINRVTLSKFMRKQKREKILEECPRFVILRCSLEQLLEPSKPSHRIRDEKHTASLNHHIINQCMWGRLKNFQVLRSSFYQHLLSSGIKAFPLNLGQPCDFLVSRLWQKCHDAAP